MRPQFDAAYIRDELERLGDHLTEPITAYLLGGGAMVFRDLKTGTKDIDLVVASGDDLANLTGALAHAGYDLVRDPGVAYAELGAQRIFENDDGCRYDVFNQQVVGKLVLTTTMKQRSQPFLNAAEFEVRLVSPEDIFLFKSVAGRVDDIEDMYTILQTGLNFDVIEAELDIQIERTDGELFVTHINEALLEMEERFGVRAPLQDRVSAITDRVYEEVAVVHALEESETVSKQELSERIPLNEDELTDVLARLTEKGVTEIDGGRITYTGNPV